MGAIKGGRGAGSLTRDSHGVAIHHVSVGYSIYAGHSVVHVLKADTRGDGRVPRTLATTRVALGFQDLVGLPSLDAVLVLTRALADALAHTADIGRPEAPAPPEGATGAALDPLRTDPLPSL